MQSHVHAGSIIKDIPVRVQDGGSSGRMAVATFGHIDIIIESPADADKAMIAIARAKSMLLGETSEPVPVSAVVADADQQTARVWAVFEAVSTRPHEDIEVAGPFTHRDAIIWAQVNALSFAGLLYVDRARTGLDAQLSPPATPGHRTDRPPTGYQLSAPNRCDGQWNRGAAHGRCIGDAHDQGLCMDATGFKFHRAPVGTEVW